MEEKIKLIIKYLLSDISPTLASKINYYQKFKKRLNLNNPQTFNEKLMYLKLKEYKNNELITKCVDKYKVREYIKKCGLDNTLNELIGVYNNANEINFDELPSQFVLKCNHGAGFNIVCKNKYELNIDESKEQLNKWLRIDFWKNYAEIQYKNVDKKIICEKFLESKDNNCIEDYKIYCFNGKPLFCMVCIGRNLEKPTYYFMDKEWKIMKINPAGKSAPENLVIEKPKSIDKMYEYAEALAKPFKFVRVDFYDYMDKPIFGELTFTPAACLDTNYIDGWDKKLGDMLEIF